MTNHIHCEKCGIQTEAKCACACGYKPMSKLQAAKLYHETHPNENDRDVAEKVGCDRETARQARIQGANNSHPGKRIARDGKSYPSRLTPERARVQSAVREQVAAGKPISRAALKTECGVGEHVGKPLSSTRRAAWQV